MLKDPLEIIKAGFSRLKSEVEPCKKDLLARLSRKEKILDADETWLDHDGNLVDEEGVVELLENALNYEHGLARLNSQQKGIAEKLRELGGGSKTAVNLKRKRSPENRNLKPYAEKKEKKTVFTKKENATLKQKIKILD
ncbi:hypothetical protein C0992_008725 [Termitomyces sp. T32_za158]|nr:hypothetical protein C0992_008725 [Termitomyces sp. T32_za158]